MAIIEDGVLKIVDDSDINMGEFVIPKGVTKIEAFAFEGHDDLIKVVIPNSVTEIEGSAFYECSSLTEVVIPESVTEIGAGAFWGCSSLTEVVIPESVTEIGAGTFSECSSLAKVVIPSSVTEIGDEAFYECSSLTEVVIPEGVTKIGKYAFSECSSLTKVVIPNSVTEIGDCVFHGCSSLNINLLDNFKLFVGMWSEFSEEQQMEFIKNNPTIFQDMLENDPEEVVRMWEKTKLKVQQKNFAIVKDVIQNNPKVLNEIWKLTFCSVKLEKFWEFQVMMKEHMVNEEYEQIIREFLGQEIEFSKDGNPIVQEDLKKIIFEKTVNEKSAEELIKELPLIIKYWNEIKRHIQLKKANNKMEDKLEVRVTSMKEILSALKQIIKPRKIAENASAQEFENTKGAERVGTDTQWTFSASTAVQRAHELALKMDMTSVKKKYPKFDVSSDNMIIRVLHPQDKSAILLGYDTNCCFRPNGNADGKAENEYSLLQYSTTTPYGGVLRCESKDGNDIYMGTPFLVNGNCMIFHSYETSKIVRNEEVNDLLVEAAKRAIEDSKDSLNIVFMTTLHGNRLNTTGKICIKPFFVPYTEGEYVVYEGMYNNLNDKNVEHCVLAAKVGGGVLTGEELMNWYVTECNQNPGILIKKLNLHMGERQQEFDFGRREVRNTLDIRNYSLVSGFISEINELESNRKILALVLQQKKLESKGEDLGEIEKQELDFISIILSIFEGKNKTQIGEFIEKARNYSIDEIRASIQQNKDEQLRFYSGDDIDLIVEILNKGSEEQIDIKAKAEEMAKAELESKKTKNKNNANRGKAIGKLMSDIKKCKNKSVTSIKDLRTKISKGTISSEELDIIESAGIDVSSYRKCIKKDEPQIKEQEQAQEQNENSQSGAIAQRVDRIMKDKSQKEAIVAELLFGTEGRFGDVTQEEVTSKAQEKLILILTTDLNKKIAMAIHKKSFEELNENERTDVTNEMHTINLVELCNGVVSGQITEQQKAQLEELRDGKYKIDIIKQYSNILGIEKEDEESQKKRRELEEKLKREIRIEKLEKLKASITIGIDMSKKIEATRRRFGNESQEMLPIRRLIYGNSWYIAVDDSDHVVEVMYDTELDRDGEERKVFEKEGRKAFKAEGRNNTYLLSADELERSTRTVTGKAKSMIIKKMKAESHQEEKDKTSKED